MSVCSFRSCRPSPSTTGGSGGRLSEYCFKAARSCSLMVVRSAFANEPFKAFSQHRRRSWRYAPLPAIFPLGSILTPSAVRTKRTSVRLGRTSRHPTQVRWGTCLGLGPFFAATLICFSRYKSKTYQSSQSSSFLRLRCTMSVSLSGSYSTV